jgi:signal transduction histidine kinase
LSTSLQPVNSQTSFSPETIALLRNVVILESLNDQSIHCLDGATEMHVEPGEIFIKQGDITHEFYLLLEGSVGISYLIPDRPEMVAYVMQGGSSFGEVPLLASIPSPTNMRASTAAHVLRLSEEQFWRLMTECPEVRKAVLKNMAMRLAKVQTTTFIQEKMASLGTLAAGLMHELNNPGAAARRASTQLRENLLRMHRLTAKWARANLTPEQKECMFDLQEQALSAKPVTGMNALDQADAEEALAEWMEKAQIEDAWRLAPTFISIGLGVETLECAQESFSGPYFSDAINWLEALVSSMQLVGIIEESIGRVTELVAAVKSYAYEGRGGQKQDLDINRSIIATLVVLGHKLREKEIVITKELAPDLPLLHSDCTGLNQIWTNLLDNAIDAAPQRGKIAIKTWAETSDQGTAIYILIKDNGGGIPLDIQQRIFDPFYTTKPVGVGTGLGLGIVYRIVEQFGGTVRFTSAPGDTEFVVRLPNPA